MEREKLSVEEAVSRLDEGETVHAFANPGINVLLGADWDRADVIEAIEKFGGAWVTGEMAQGMKHGIAVQTENGLFFFKTKESR